MLFIRCRADDGNVTNYWQKTTDVGHYRRGLAAVAWPYVGKQSCNLEETRVRYTGSAFEILWSSYVSWNTTFIIILSMGWYSGPLWEARGIGAFSGMIIGWGNQISRKKISSESQIKWLALKPTQRHGLWRGHCGYKNCESLFSKYRRWTVSFFSHKVGQISLKANFLKNLLHELQILATYNFSN
jgi:hypothetical protein